ncbi:MAG TPA: PAS domain S-box protein, partial [Fimbriimonadaceae bacterium]|nr:PAS domain S-box protein [Fimbriimonadaceae bacterium]
MGEERDGYSFEPGEELYRHLFLHSPIPMWIADRHTLAILDFNLSARLLYGLSEEERGQVSIQVFRPDATLDQIRSDYELLASRPGLKLERTHRLRSGQTVDVLVTAHAVRYGGRECNLVQIIDLTELKSTERSLEVSEKRLRRLIEQSPISVQTFSPEGFAIDANPAWEELFGSTKDQLRGYNVLQDPQLEAKGIRPYIERAFAGESQAIPPK